jgi:hypothetical protein
VAGRPRRRAHRDPQPRKGLMAAVRVTLNDGRVAVGTNACVIVTEPEPGDLWVYAQSRTRIITPGKSTDNFGFAQWVADHKHELATLGEGYHFGEWYGAGIQRGYGLEEKRFALFNVDRWSDQRPACCDVVPVLCRTTPGFLDRDVHTAQSMLRDAGSALVPGFDKPEGLVIYHHAGRHTYKVLLEGDELPKGVAA